MQAMYERAIPLSDNVTVGRAVPRSEFSRAELLAIHEALLTMASTQSTRRRAVLLLASRVHSMVAGAQD
jgi:hypothetical protein